MPSETFHCPHCGRELKKSAQAYVLGEIMRNKDARLIGMGAPAETVTCPGCGAVIDAQKMMRGDYDSGATNAGCITGLVVFAAGIAVLFYFGWTDDMWAAVLPLIAVGAGAAWGVSWLERRFRQAR